MKLSLAMWTVICNQILLSTLWYFVTVWGGSNKIIRMSRGAIRNYLWSGKDQFICTRDSWKECYIKQKKSILWLVNPNIAEANLMCKWIVRAMKLGKSNFQLMLSYRLARLNPQEVKKWGVSIDWFSNKIHQGILGSEIWGTLVRRGS